MKDIKKLKIMTILGTRPEIIRLSRILPKMDKYFHHLIVYTRQSYDYELSEIFFKELDLRKPDYLLEVKAVTLGEQIANIIKQTEKAMLKERPDALLILGDTNSALSAIIAKRLKILIFHMEAGNRCFDWDVPEEVNRRIVDHISDFNLAYTEHARRYLLREGLHPGTIYVTGSPLTEVYAYFKEKIESSSVLEKLGLQSKKFFLVSAHREENIENENRLKELFGSFNFLAENYQLPIIVSLHPRTRKKIKSLKKIHSLVKFHQPFGFLDYNKLQKNALCVLSDSGTIQEESAALGFRAVQIRVSSERPEAFDKGSIILTGFNQESLATAIKLLLSEQEKGEKMVLPPDYQDTNVSSKVVKLILGLTGIKKYHDFQIQPI